MESLGLPCIQRYFYQIWQPKIHYCKKYLINDLNKIDRFIIFLEDAKMGHMFAFEDKVYYKWQAGDVVSWSGQTPHAAYNIGNTNRYTLQITCTKI